jgi:hypothetical protein
MLADGILPGQLCRSVAVTGHINIANAAIQRALGIFV